MSLFRACVSPCAIRSRQSFSSSAFSGRGKEPPSPPERRSVKKKTVDRQQYPRRQHGISSLSRMFVPIFLISYSLGASPYVPHRRIIQNSTNFPLQFYRKQIFSNISPQHHLRGGKRCYNLLCCVKKTLQKNGMINHREVVT